MNPHTLCSIIRESIEDADRRQHEHASDTTAAVVTALMPVLDELGRKLGAVSTDLTVLTEYVEQLGKKIDVSPVPPPAPKKSLCFWRRG